MISINNKLIVKPYKKEGLRSVEKNGLAFVEQKSKLVGLELLVEAKLNDGRILPSGSIAYVKEEILHTQPWAQKTFNADTIEQPFLILDLSFVEMIDGVDA